MATEVEKREQAIADYRKKLLKHREVDGKVRTLRESVKELKKEYEKTEDDLKALQSVGQIIGEVLRQLDDERCECGGAWRAALAWRGLGAMS
jgi:26S proteasome regulatory subunit T4